MAKVASVSLIAWMGEEDVRRGYNERDHGVGYGSPRGLTIMSI